MENKILINQSVYSNLVKTVISTNKLLKKLEERTNTYIEKPDFEKEWLTIKEIDDEFNISRRRIMKFEKDGLKIIRKVRGGGIIIRRSELIKFLTKK
jgi:hypothetical protein